MNTLPATPSVIADAARILRGGGLVAFPTETVYGLGADATDDKAVARIFAAKGRPAFNPLIVHVPDLATAESFAEFSAPARDLAGAFWPGGLTLVLPRKPSALSLLVSAGLDTVALRVPASAIAQALLRETGRPLAAPSANASGSISPTTAAHVAESLGGKVDLILDGGPASRGIESTVIGFADGPTLLRPGAIAREEIERVVGPLKTPAHGIQGSPGRLESHYAPRKPLRTDAASARDGEALLGFGTNVPPGAFNLSTAGDLVEAAANLFAMLRTLDASPARAIAVMPVPAHGLGEAINDRLEAGGAFMSDTVSRLKDAVGAKGFSEDPAEIAPHLEEWRGKFHGRTSLLLKPRTTAQVAAVLTICHETGTAVVPQGGNTGLVGGQIPFHGEVLLSLSRMKAIRAVEETAMICEAGVILADAQKAALEAGRYFPLSLAPEGTCTIGGNLSTNAGGTNVLRYGNAREQVLGLEVVLADGRVLEMLRTLRKDNTGYDLKQLFIGAEGTLGIITAAALKLYAKPEVFETAFVAVRDPSAALALLARLEAATGGLISGFELMPRIGLEMVLAHIPGTADPLRAPAPWYVLAEASGGAAMHLRAALETALSASIDAGLATDAVLAASEAQRASLWKLRESLSEAQKPEGGSIKHDVSLPTRAIPDFLRRGVALVETIVPGARPVPFGHLGDGNIHFNISVPKGGDNAAFLAQWERVARAVHDLVHAMGGSISAEHGIGVLKRDDLARYKSAEEMDMMRALKAMLDPKGILNPGKVV